MPSPGATARWRRAAGLALALALLALAAAQGSDGEGAADATADGAATDVEEVSFRHPLDDAPIDIPRPEGDARTEATERFHDTGENLYVEEDAEDAVADGAELFAQHCTTCHGEGAEGGMGPNLIDDRYRYARTDTAVGMFEVVHEGGAGAMQSFAPRLTQDQMLRILAHIDGLTP